MSKSHHSHSTAKTKPQGVTTPHGAAVNNKQPTPTNKLMLANLKADLAIIRWEDMLPKSLLPYEVPHSFKFKLIKRLLENQTVLTSQQISGIRKFIETIENEEERGELYLLLQKKVPYHSQRDNLPPKSKGQSQQYIADRMCNLTSLAMAFESLGITNPSDVKQFEDYLEELRLPQGKRKTLGDRKSVTTWQELAKKFDVKYDEKSVWFPKGRITKEYALENIQPRLKKGHAVILSVFKPDKGHIVRLQEITDEGIIVDDPFGKVNLAKREAGGSGFGKTSNPKSGEEGQLLGEDNLWTWKELANVTMKYYVVFYR